ncbi:MAG: 16S rRNA (cytosine(967)-C(5))-methyltransferase RsmB [Luminiphilus sp.]|nr:16S rRNA (cytosine(967)-C(5))-methyltransferase RsmB [Luminiphilus sp.]
MPSPRAKAAAVIHRVLQGESLNQLLPHSFESLELGQRALCQELVYGTLREWPLYQATCQKFLRKALRRKDQDLLSLICVGLYELDNLRTPSHAAISEAVNGARDLKKPWAGGMVNAVLRSYQREQAGLRETLTPAAQHALPDWLFEILTTEYGECFEQIAEAARGRPPMFLRVNQRHLSRAQYLQLLNEAGMAAAPAPLSPEAVLIEKPVDVALLPGFTKGWVSVQDVSAQLVAGVLAARPGERVLDACAAPGGKACHILEQQPALAELTAMDISQQRLQRVRENGERLGLAMTTVTADASQLQESIRMKQFDAILADVPCSATGVIRRNPDVKILRQAGDIASFGAQQLAILKGLWPALKPGGRLLYVTCSLLKAENDSIIAAFTDHNESIIHPLSLGQGLPTQFGWQTLPHPSGGDGLFFSLLEKPG